MNTTIQGAAERLRGAKKVIALTGAGASVESGIPDFRSPGGLWTTYPPEEYATIDAFIANPDKVWKLWYELGQSLHEKKPNAGHKSLAALEKLCPLEAVITQNIDNLHQLAGSSEVIEYHGNARRIQCMDCKKVTPLSPTLTGPKAPRCECGGLQKPDIVFFGELIPPDAMTRADALAQTCDVVIVVGTSAQVFPAAGIPFMAKEHGATIIECNLEPTDFTKSITDIFLEGPSGTTLPALEQALRIP